MQGSRTLHGEVFIALCFQVWHSQYMTTKGWLTISVCGRRWCWTQLGCRPWCRCRPPVDGGFAAYLKDTERGEEEETDERQHMWLPHVILEWNVIFERQTKCRVAAISNFMCWYSSPGPASLTCWWGWCCQGGGYQTPGCGLAGRTLSFLGSRQVK